MTMKLRIIIAVLVFSGTFAAKSPERHWQPATVLEFNSNKLSTTTGTSTSGTVDRTGNIGAVTTQRERRYDEDSYAIDAGDRILIVTETIQRMGGALGSVRLRKGAQLTPGDSVKFALEKGSIYIMDSQGKEHKLRVQRVTMKATHP